MKEREKRCIKRFRDRERERERIENRRGRSEGVRPKARNAGNVLQLSDTTL